MSNNRDRSEATWFGADVRVAEIDSALSRLLVEINPRDNRGEPHPPMRASVLNLVVRTGDDPAGTLPVWREICARYPARTLVVARGPDAPTPALDARITAYCHRLPHTRARVCHETVELALRGPARDHPASIVAPLLVSDLPVVLWWPGALPSPQDDLLQLCDRLIVDSRDAAASELAGLNRFLGDPTRVADLAWYALGPWREALAQLFDPPPARVIQRQLRTVQVEYVSGRPPTSLFLLLGWLGICLGWQLVGPAGPEAARLRFHSATGTVEVQAKIAASAAGLAAGEMRAVALAGEDPAPGSSFRIDRHDDGISATARSESAGGTTRERVFPLPSPSLATLLSQALDRPASDPLYPAAAALAGTIAAVWSLPG